jgi:hypothetical protein
MVIGKMHESMGYSGKGLTFLEAANREVGTGHT